MPLKWSLRSVLYCMRNHFLRLLWSSFIRNLPVFFCLLGIYSIKSVILQSRYSQIRSRYSIFRRSVISLYMSLIVEGLIPVWRASSAWVIRFSPSILDRCIFIIFLTAFVYNVTLCYYIIYKIRRSVIKLLHYNCLALNIASKSCSVLISQSTSPNFSLFFGNYQCLYSKE